MAEIRQIRAQDYRAVRAFLLESADLYPNIDRWCDTKVLPDLTAGQRIGLMIEEGGAPAGILIAKPGRRAKLCSIRVREPIRSQGWGTKLLVKGVERLCAQGTEEVYVTVSEALEVAYRRFFESLRFTLCARLKSKYVNGIDEFVYTWPREEMITFVGENDDETDHCTGELGIKTEETLPTMLMSIRPEFSRSILEGSKRIEFRRRFSRKHVGKCVLFYVSSPEQSFQFTARISDVQRSRTEELWERYHSAGGVDEQTFRAYFRGSETGYAVELSEVRPLRQEIKLAEAVSRCPGLSPPQSFKMLRHSTSFLSIWHERHVREVDPCGLGSSVRKR